jgi:hypothetical protein
MNSVLHHAPAHTQYCRAGSPFAAGTSTDTTFTTTGSGPGKSSAVFHDAIRAASRCFPIKPT